MKCFKIVWPIFKNVYVCFKNNMLPKFFEYTNATKNTNHRFIFKKINGFLFVIDLERQYTYIEFWYR